MWQQCVDRLQNELPSQQFNTWIRPLQASKQGQLLTLIAPNRFIKDFVSDKFAERISQLVRELEPGSGMDVVLEIGSTQAMVSGSEQVRPRAVLQSSSGNGLQPALSGQAVSGARHNGAQVTPIRSNAVPVHQERRLERRSELRSERRLERRLEVEQSLQHQHHLVENYTFDNFVEGKSNQLALAAAQQVAENPEIGRASCRERV